MWSELWKPVLGGLGAIIVAVLTTALSPLGPTLREVVFPTSALVEGWVVRQGAPAVAEVMLDGREETRDGTDGYGQFLFTGVSAGEHCYSIIEHPNRTVWIDAFDVPRGVTEKHVISQYDIQVARPSSGITRACGATANPPELAEAPAPAPEATAAPAASPAGAGDRNRPVRPLFVEEMVEASSTLEALEVFIGDGGPAESGSVIPRWTDGYLALATMEAGAIAAETWLVEAGDALATPAAAVLDSFATLSQQPATMAPELLPAGLSPDARLVEVTIDAEPAELATIDSVTYYLDPSLSPSVITRESPEDGFALTLVANEPTALSADVQYADGHIERLTTEVTP